MPRQKSGSFDQNRYIQEYVREKEKVKRVVFNKENDADLLEWAEEAPDGFSAYVKRLIREDMAART